jgi:hypothetical protein
MDEETWLSCNHPDPMLGFLRGTGRATDRKVRLFAAACCRRVWHLTTDERSRQAVEVAERFADGRANRKERKAAERAVWAAREELFEAHDGSLQTAAAALFAVL